MKALKIGKESDVRIKANTRLVVPALFDEWLTPLFSCPLGIEYRDRPFAGAIELLCVPCLPTP